MGTAAQSEEAARLALEASAKDAKATGYGLRQAALSPVETLAQSISGVAPTLAPFMTIPLIFTLSGNGTWLAFALATAAILPVAWCVGRFARYSASPGSLYSYAAMILPPWLAATAAWSLLLAYVATSAANIGGFYHYTNVMLRNASGHAAPTLLLAAMAAGVPMWIAWRDVKISARLMLMIEIVSVSLILTVLVLVQSRHGLHGDPEQAHLRGMTGSGLREGIVLALFSFVGFESATALGSEARDPLKTIPRAVILTSILAGVFFMICAFVEVLGLRMSGQNLGTSGDPMHVLASVGGIPMLGPVIDVGALVSMFAGTLACLTAAARVLLLMAHDGLAHRSLRETHARNGTPGGAILATGLGAFVPVAVLAAWHSSGLDVYRVARNARDVWIRRQLWIGLLCASRLFARSPRRGQLGNADDPVDRVCGHGVCAGRQSVSCAGRRVRQAALYLSRLFGGDDRAVCDRRQRQEPCPREGVAFCVFHEHAAHARRWGSQRRHHEALYYEGHARHE